MKAGMAAGRIFTRGEHRHRVVIGKDTRLSGYMIESALVSGFTAVGMDVFQFGPLPTPAVAMLTRSLRADLGVMITASHNPYQDNGIKFFGPDGQKLSDAVELEIERADGWRAWKQGLAPSAPDRPRQARRRQPGALYRIRQAHLSAQSAAGRPAHRDRLRQWRRLQGGARSVVGTGRRYRAHGRLARRHQHQPGLRFDRARGDVRQGARSARRFRHRAGRRRRPGGDGGRAWPHHRRRPDSGPDRQKLVEERHAQGRRRGRHGDVQCRARPLSQDAGAVSWRAPRWATAMCWKKWPRAASMSAANSPAISSCRTSPPPATG